MISFIEVFLLAAIFGVMYAMLSLRVANRTDVGTMQRHLPWTAASLR
jgi:hypothetical protein